MTVLLFRGCGEGPDTARGRAGQGGPHGRWAGATKASTEAREQPMKGGYRRTLERPGLIAKKIPHGREETEHRKEKK